jgi:isoleucyl-tRNA synthetase
VKRWGADVLRLWVASQDFRNDIVVSEERMNKVAEAYRVLRNALRFQLANLFDFDPARHAVPDARLTGLDRWMLHEFSRLEADVLQAYDACEFHVVFQKVSQFAAVELSAVYHDLIKDRLYTDPADSLRRRSTQTALHRLVTGLCKMLAPILSFTADEAWEFIPGREADSVHLALWHPAPFPWSEQEATWWRGLFALRERALPELESARQVKRIGKALEAKLTLRGPAAALAELRPHADTLRELLNVSQLQFEELTAPDPAAADSTATNLLGAGVQLHVAKADGQKCERCWHWETDVGANASHPTLCARCVQALPPLPPIESN